MTPMLVAAGVIVEALESSDLVAIVGFGPLSWPIFLDRAEHIFILFLMLIL